MDGAKRKRDYESGTDVIGAALSRMEDATVPALSAARGASFVPSAAFAGARAGYFFGRGAQGVGYYADARGPGGAAAAAASAAMPPPQRSAAQVRCPLRARDARHCCRSALHRSGGAGSRFLGGLALRSYAEPNAKGGANAGDAASAVARARGAQRRAAAGGG
jgi:hypothetical protein